ncbi:MAG: hypothetical protein JO051_18110 [Acidobacteriaceae bacterium]|nr:hypothetical protein [Acidobacteriaceae bacterium]
MRAFIAFLPATKQARERIDRLRAEVASAQTSVSGPWGAPQRRLRYAILNHDPRAFLTWDVIAETMSPPPYSRFIRSERQFLTAHDWTRWSRALAGRACLSAANAVHQAYHLCRFEMETGLTIRDFDLIVEFGGGYGEMRRIVDRLGFAGRYIIFDLPELNALQQFFFSTNAVPSTVTVSDVQAVAAVLESEAKSRKLFIATWSFDEIPLELRESWGGLLAGFDAFLIAYQTDFEGLDNQSFFEDWQRLFPRIVWKAYPNSQLKDSYYLFGVAHARSNSNRVTEAGGNV